MNSLAPDWCNASPDATHYVIHADGAAAAAGLPFVAVPRFM